MIIKAMTVIHMVTQKRPSVIFPWSDATGNTYPSKLANEYHRNPPMLVTENTIKRNALTLLKESTLLFSGFTNPTRLLILKIINRMATTSTTPNPIIMLIIILSLNQLLLHQM